MKIFRLVLQILIIPVFFCVPAMAAEDVRSLKDVNLAGGINRDEANVIAKEFFHRYISSCGLVGNPVEKNSVFEYPLFLGKKEKPYSYPLTVDKTSGQVAVEKFYSPIDFSGINTELPLKQILHECDASDEDILAGEFWLQQEREARIFCPATDYYFLNLKEEDYPPEAAILAPYQKYVACKYGNPATIFAVFTPEKSPAKKEACTEQQLADVRAQKAYEFQELESPDESAGRRFKLVSPHFAAVVYTTVYDVSRYDYWVDRSYEILRYVENYLAVDCICPAGCSAAE